MGLERVTVTAKIDPEVLLWIQGMRRNVFPWLSQSAVINEILGTVMRALKANDLQATQQIWQELNRNYRNDRNEGIPQCMPNSVNSDLQAPNLTPVKVGHRKAGDGSHKEKCA